MNGDDDTKGRELVPDEWRELDDTLADGPAPGDVPGAAKSWLADQRFLHGLLRALHTQDAAAREGRIEAILARIDGEARVEPRRHWLAVATVALLLACFGVWFVLPPALPTAEAAVQRAVTELAREVARRFRVEVVGHDPKGKEMLRHEFALVAQPGSRFRVTGRLAFGGLRTGEMTLGCDGQELWLMSANGSFRGAEPLAERGRLMKGLGDALDLGYLDVHDLVKKLPEDFELGVVGRELDAAGRPLLRIEATRKRPNARAQLNTAWLLCDEATGMVTRIEVEVAFPRGGTRRMSIGYLGEEPPGLVVFERPW